MWFLNTSFSLAFELGLHHLLCVSSLGEQSERGWEKCLYSP